MVTALLSLALIVASVAAFYFYLKGTEKDREITRLNHKVNFVQTGWDDSRKITENLNGQIDTLQKQLEVKDNDIASLVDTVEKRNLVITDMAHEINRLTPPPAPTKATSKKAIMTDMGAQSLRKAKGKGKSKK